MLKAMPRVVGSRFMNQTKMCVHIHTLWDELLEHTLKTHSDAKQGQDQTNQLVALMLVYLQQPWRRILFRAATLMHSDCLSLVFHELIYVRMADKAGVVFNGTVSSLDALCANPAMLLERVKAGKELIPRDVYTFLLDRKYTSESRAATVVAATSTARAAAAAETDGGTARALMHMVQFTLDSLKHYAADWLDVSNGRFSLANLDGHQVHVLSKTPNNTNITESHHGTYDSYLRRCSDIALTHRIAGKTMCVRNKSLVGLASETTEEQNARIDNARKKGPAHAKKMRRWEAECNKTAFEEEQKKAQDYRDKKEAEQLVHFRWLQADRSRLDTAAKLTASLADKPDAAKVVVLHHELDIYRHVYHKKLSGHKRSDGKPTTQKSLSSGVPLPLATLLEVVTKMINVVNDEDIVSDTVQQHAARRDLPVDPRPAQALDLKDAEAVLAHQRHIVSLPSRTKFVKDKCNQRVRMASTRTGKAAQAKEAREERERTKTAAKAKESGGDDAMSPVGESVADRFVCTVGLLPAEKNNVFGVIVSFLPDDDNQVMVRLDEMELTQLSINNIVFVADPTAGQMSFAARLLSYVTPARLLAGDTDPVPKPAAPTALPAAPASPKAADPIPAPTAPTVPARAAVKRTSTQAAPIPKKARVRPSYFTVSDDHADFAAKSSTSAVHDLGGTKRKRAPRDVMDL